MAVTDRFRQTARLDDLAQQVVHGDRTAFDRIIELTETEVRGFVALHAMSLDMVDEVVQQAYIIGFQRIATYRGSGSLASWLKGIAKNCLRAELRANHRERQMPGDLLEQWLAERQLVDLEAVDAEGEAERRLARLRVCLEQVPERSRRILQRRYNDRLRIADLAELFDSTTAAMAKTVQRLLGRLRTCMEMEARP